MNSAAPLRAGWAPIPALVAVLALGSAAAVSAQTRPDPAPRLPPRIVVQVQHADGTPYTRSFEATIVGAAGVTPRSRSPGVVIFSPVPPGRYEVRIGGLASPCVTSRTTRAVTVPGDTLVFPVRCDEEPNGEPDPEVPLPPPTAEIVPGDTTVSVGQSIQLSFRATGARSGRIEAGNRLLETFGPDDIAALAVGERSAFTINRMVSADSRTEYRFTVTGADGDSDTATGVVRVPAPPKAEITTSEGDQESIVVRMEARRASSATLRADGYPRVEEHFDAPPNGELSESVSVPKPMFPTTYTLTVTGPGGTVTDSTMVTVHVRDKPKPPGKEEGSETDAVGDPGWAFELGGAGVLMAAGDAWLAAPALSAVAARGLEWRLEVRGGLRPAGSESGPTPNVPRSRRQSVMSASVQYFPFEWQQAKWGVAISYVAGWESVRELDYYLSQLNGPAVGPRVRARTGRWNVIVGLDFQYTRVSAAEDVVARWKFGLTPSVGLTRVFGDVVR